MEQPQVKRTLNINFSSLAIGFLLAVCLLLTLGNDALTQAEPDGPGPFQVCPAGDLSVFVLDSQTGQVWVIGRTDTYDYGTPWQRRSVRKSIMPTVE
jgi:hypothetical protein